MAKHSAEAKALADLIARKTNEQAPTQMARARELARIIIPRAGRLPANVLRDAEVAEKMAEYGVSIHTLRKAIGEVRQESKRKIKEKQEIYRPEKAVPQPRSSAAQQRHSHSNGSSLAPTEQKTSESRKITDLPPRSVPISIQDSTRDNL